MRYLLYFFRKHYYYFLFIALEVISLVLLVNYNAYQNSALSKVSGGIAGSVLEAYSNVFEYFSLTRVNRILAEDNARMHSSRMEAFYQADTNSFFYKDTIYRLEYRYISANEDKINSTYSFNTSLYIHCLICTRITTDINYRTDN